jgi:Tfp pilus assembly protein PilF
MTGCGSARDTTKAETRLDLARDLLARGEVSGAEAEAKKALGYDSRSEEAHNLLGLVRLLRAQQNNQLAEKADCLKGSDAEALRLQSDQEMHAAEGSFRKAVELAPDYGEAWNNRAVVAMYFHDWEKAADFEQKALEHLERLENPPLARANLGWAYYQKQDFVHAVTELLQANQQVTRFFCLGKYRLAEVYFARKEFEQAAEAVRPMLDDPKLCPPLQEAAYVGAQSFIRLHDLGTAKKALQACVDMAPKSCQARECRKALAEFSR